MEVERGQLIDDDAHGQVALAVDTCDESVEDKGVERADDLFLFGVVGDDKVAGGATEVFTCAVFTRFWMQSKWALHIKQWVDTVVATCGREWRFQSYSKPIPTEF